jgi:hypothetical protein
LVDSGKIRSSVHFLHVTSSILQKSAGTRVFRRGMHDFIPHRAPLRHIRAHALTAGHWPARTARWPEG